MDPVPAAQPLIGEEERAAVERVLLSGRLAQGEEVAAFEREFSDALVAGVPCVATSSGTAGAHLGLVAAGIGVGDEVIVPSFTFAATANAVALTGATPVFADIEPDSFCLDPRAVEAAVGPRTVAVMPVHLYGHPADMTAIGDVCRRHGLAMFEDAAQAHGATWDGQQVGTFGIFGMFSLYPTKNMTAGEGGMDSVSDPEVERRLRLLRNQGMERRYENELIGHNARMTEIHAALGRVQLAKLAAWTDTVARTPPTSTRTSTAWSRRRCRRGLSTSTTSTRSECPRAATRWPDACRLSTTSAPVSTTPPRPCAPVLRSRPDLPETAERRLRCCRCPSTLRSMPGDLERVVEAFNACAGQVVG